jgi:hypothetical protein
MTLKKQLTCLKSIDEGISENTIELVTVARVLKNVITNGFTYHKELKTRFRI